jgi:hypothetical protein
LILDNERIEEPIRLSMKSTRVIFYLSFSLFTDIAVQKVINQSSKAHL